MNIYIYMYSWLFIIIGPKDLQVYMYTHTHIIYRNSSQLPLNTRIAKLVLVIFSLYMLMIRKENTLIQPKLDFFVQILFY